MVIPIINEKEAIEKVLEEVQKYGYKKFLVVDGYSTDGSPELAAKWGARVVGQVGKGKTGALITAINQVKTPYMLVLDGDYTYDPACIKRMLVHARGYDEIIGARTDGRQHIPLINRIGNHVLNWLFRVLFSVRLSDVCSGMYLLRTKAVKAIDLVTGGFDVEVEIASQLALRGRVAEVPVSYRPRLGKQKLSSLRHGLKIATTIVRLANVYNPVLLYSGIIALALIPSIIALTWVLYERIFMNTWHAGYALFSIMLFLLAAQGLSVATISIMIHREEDRLEKVVAAGSHQRS